MRIDREELRKKIEERIADSVMHVEEVDITTSKIMGDVWPIIEQLKMEAKK